MKKGPRLYLPGFRHGLLACALAAGAAFGQAVPTTRLVDDLLGDLLDGGARPWSEARAEVLERDDALGVVRAVFEGAEYDPSTWARLVLAEALALHLTRPEEAERLRNLEGLDSEHYLRLRRPGPSVVAELRRLGPPAPLMIELFLKDIDSYDWSSLDAAADEEAALRHGLLIAIGQSRHPASVHFLTFVIEQGCSCCESCEAAVRGLGETRSERAVPVLLGFLEQARLDGDAEGQSSALVALGRLRLAEVWPHLQAELANPDPAVRAAAAQGGAALGSRFHWRANPAEGLRLRNVIGAALVESLAGEGDEAVATAFIESLSILATPEVRDRIEQRLPASVADPAALASAATVAGGDRFAQALRRVDRALARRVDRRERER